MLARLPTKLSSISSLQVQLFNPVKCTAAAVKTVRVQLEGSLYSGANCLYILTGFGTRSAEAVFGCALISHTDTKAAVVHDVRI